MRTMIEGRDYEFLDILVENAKQTTPIRLIADNEFKGTIFQFGEIWVDENPPTLHFDYHILDNPGKIDESFPDFKQYIGDLLVSYISNTLISEDNVSNPHDRKNNT